VSIVAVSRRELGEILLEADLINPSQLDEVLGIQKTSGERLASLLVRKRILTEKFAVTYLGRQVGFPGVDLSQTEIDLSMLDLVPLTLCERHRVFPIRKDGERLQLAMMDPSDAALVSRIEGLAKVQLAPMAALESSIKHAIREARQARSAGRRTITPNIQDADGEVQVPAEPPPAPSAPTGPPETRESASGLAEDAARSAPTTAPAADDVVAALDMAPARVLEPTAEVPLRVLIAGADTQERARAASLFTERRHRVMTAASGREALAVTRERTPDLILLDTTLPGVDGLDVCRQLKQSDRVRHIPVILCVSPGLGWRFAADAREQCGADDVVERPFDEADLFRRIGLLTDRVTPGLPQQTEATVRQHLKDGVVALKQGRHEDAVSALRTGLDADPYNDLLHYYLGMAYEKQEQWFPAIEHYEKSVQVNAEFYDAIVSLAKLYQRQKFRRKALEMWELALQATREESVRERIKAHVLELL
jgi:CheY-like chemotaxis protein